MYAAIGGGGGAAGTSSGSNASSGSSGSASYVEIYDSDGILKWGLRASGGNAGKGATSTNFGSGASLKDKSTCQIYNGSSWVYTSCTYDGLKGDDGASSTDSTAAANGGVGGGSMYNTSTSSGGGQGGSNSHENGYDATNWGAGGGGGTVRFTTSGSTTTAYKGKGGSGKNGVAEITYDIMYPAAGGGGGGGGAFAHIKDITVTAGNTYTLRVAAGGNAGGTGANGIDGGTTSATFDSVTYSLSGGKGGLIGTSQSDTASLVQGTGGAKGIVSTNVSDTSGLKFKNGSDGFNAGTLATDALNIYGGSYGGNGGTSGIDTIGGCGGLFNDSNICTNTNVSATSVPYNTVINVLNASDYGSAGAGGGGGGWSENTTFYPTPGSGSAGQDGYIYLYWSEY